MKRLYGGSKPNIELHPKSRQERSNFWGVFIMKLTFEDKIQICKFLKQGCTFVWNKNQFVYHNDK